MIVSTQIAMYPLRQERLTPAIAAVRDARPLLGRARDFTLPSLRAAASAAAGPRLRALRWAAALFPGGLAGRPARIPLGDVIGISVELTA